MIKRRIRVQSSEPITKEIVDKIKDIFRESYTPNEAMNGSIEGFTSFDGYKNIQLYSGNAFVAEFDVEMHEV